MYEGLSTICLTLRLKPIARLKLYEQAMNSWSGKRPRCHAGKFLEAISLLPCRGGMSSMRRGEFPAATSSLKRSKRLQMSSWTHPALYLGYIR